MSDEQFHQEAKLRQDIDALQKDLADKWQMIWALRNELDEQREQVRRLQRIIDAFREDGCGW